MTRKEDRLERSRDRSEEFRRRSRMRLTLFATAAVFYVVVPLLWYGAVEFGFVHPIQTPEFKSATNTAALALLMMIVLLSPEAWRRTGKDFDHTKDSSSNTPTTTE